MPCLISMTIEGRLFRLQEDEKWERLDGPRDYNSKTFTAHTPNDKMLPFRPKWAVDCYLATDMTLKPLRSVRRDEPKPPKRNDS